MSAYAEHQEQNQQQDKAEANDRAHYDDWQSPGRGLTATSSTWRRYVALTQHFSHLFHVETISGAVQRQLFAVQPKLAQTPRHACYKSTDVLLASTKLTFLQF